LNNFSKNLLLWATISLIMVVLFNLFNQPQAPQTKLTYSEFLAKVDDGSVLEVTIQGPRILGEMMDGAKFVTYTPEDPELVAKLIERKVRVSAKPEDETPWYMSLFLSWFPMLLLIGVWIFFMRQMQGGGGKAMSFGRSKARLVTQETAKVTFEDVAGVDEAKEELTEVVDFLSDPKRFTRLGGRIPKGVLLVGPPGTGKTLLSRAVAGEAGVPFFSISGSDFVEMFVGVGAARVRDLFIQGKKNAPCLIFIDEIDAVGRQRGAGLGGGHDEREQTLNQLLVEMDGFESNEGVILIAATNRPDVLDPALLRPGRFDRQVVVPTPDLRGRKRILEVHSRRTPLSNDVDLDTLARATPGFSGADLENLVNEAALYAAKQNKDQINMSDFEEAKDKVIMGKERRSLILSEEEKRTTAYHEGGHALVAKLLPNTDPVHKVSIIPRGRALGVTAYLPIDERHTYSRDFLENTLAFSLGGRAAEWIVFKQLNTGASNDLERASKLARNMVCKWGMSDAIGPLSLGEKDDEIFIGRDIGHFKNYSEETARLIDTEVKRIMEEAQHKAESLLRDNLDVLHRIAEALLERETISGADIDLIMRGEELPPFNHKLKNPKPGAGKPEVGDDEDFTFGHHPTAEDAEHHEPEQEGARMEEGESREHASPRPRDDDAAAPPDDSDSGKGEGR
jgi:cell division protease FtsH